MSHAIDGLEPSLLWKYFAELSLIPRGSKNEKAAAAWVMRTARKLGLECRQDGTGNVLVRKPASPGRERTPSVCLQGHLDMVCERRPEKKHDFTKDPITLVRDGNLMRADGTTLGADNGIAVGTCLAIMEDRALVHGPLELLFTVDEETGLTGANGIEPGFLQSRILINLDSEDEGTLTVGCSGGRDTGGAWALERDAAPAGSVALEVKVAGLRGGHSGVEIHQGRGNAIKILARAVTAVAALGGRVSRMDGGNARNAIPRDATALVFVPKARAGEAGAAVAALDATVRAELAGVEPGFKLTATAVKTRGSVIRRGVQKKVLQTLTAFPHGVLKMSADIPGLVETSTNLAVIRTTAKQLTVITSQRSSVASEMAEAGASVEALFELGGATVKASDGYVGWKPNLDSPLLRNAVATYRERYGREPKVEAIHAGLECGIIGVNYEGMDMISLGPTIKDVHSPDENVHIDTVKLYWDYLLAILGNVR